VRGSPPQLFQTTLSTGCIRLLDTAGLRSAQTVQLNIATTHSRATCSEKHFSWSCGYVPAPMSITTLQLAVSFCGWEGNRGSCVALFILSRFKAYEREISAHRIRYSRKVWQPLPLRCTGNPPPVKIDRWSSTCDREWSWWYCTLPSTLWYSQL